MLDMQCNILLSSLILIKVDFVVLEHNRINGILDVRPRLFVCDVLYSLSENF